MANTAPTNEGTAWNAAEIPDTERSTTVSARLAASSAAPTLTSNERIRVTTAISIVGHSDSRTTVVTASLATHELPRSPLTAPEIQRQ